GLLPRLIEPRVPASGVELEILEVELLAKIDEVRRGQLAEPMDNAAGFPFRDRPSNAAANKATRPSNPEWEAKLVRDTRKGANRLRIPFRVGRPDRKSTRLNSSHT